MANVLDILKPLAQPSMNGFDLSTKRVYGGVAGRIDSPLQVETIAHDSFKINIGALMRTMTPETAPFLRGKVSYDFYFVPYTQIWHPFNQFIDQRKDVHSTRQLGTKFVPVFNLGDLLSFIRRCALELINNSSAMNDYNDIENISWYANIWHMLDFFGYGNYLWLKEYCEDTTLHDEDWKSIISPFSEKYLNIFRPAAYQHIWYDYYRNKFYDEYDEIDNTFSSDYVAAFNFDDIQCDTFANSVIPINYDDVSFSHCCELNKRIIMLFTQRYCQYKQDIFQSALPSQQFGAVSDVQIDINGSTLIHGTASLDGSTGNDLDKWVTVSGGSIASNSNVKTNSDHSALFAESGGHTILHTHSISGSANVQASAGFTGHGAFDVITLKRAEALQKWRQNAMRAGNMVDDNFRAQFGVSPRYESDNNALKLGSFEGSLNVNAVETTAQYNGSGNNKVGSLGSSVSCVISGREIDFRCSDFGVIVCMQFFRPESEYSSTMVDRANTLYEPFDFACPALCNTGLNPVTLADINFMDAVSPQGTILGYASQYWWYKSAFDKCLGEFAKYKYFDNSHEDRYLFKGDSVIWCAPRQLDLVNTNQSEYYRAKSNLYVNPNILNDLFGVNYYLSTNVKNVVNQLIFNTYFDIKAIRPLTVVGLPNF